MRRGFLLLPQKGRSASASEAEAGGPSLKNEDTMGGPSRSRTDESVDTSSGSDSPSAADSLFTAFTSPDDQPQPLSASPEPMYRRRPRPFLPKPSHPRSVKASDLPPLPNDPGPAPHCRGDGWDNNLGDECVGIKSRFRDWTCFYCGRLISLAEPRHDGRGWSGRGPDPYDAWHREVDARALRDGTGSGVQFPTMESRGFK